jgi:hypothetical protein
MGVLDSLCLSCHWARPKPTCCLDCPFVETCGMTKPGTPDNKYCHHSRQDPEVCCIEVKVCSNFKEAVW